MLGSCWLSNVVAFFYMGPAVWWLTASRSGGPVEQTTQMCVTHPFPTAPGGRAAWSIRARRRRKAVPGFSSPRRARGMNLPKPEGTENSFLASVFLSNQKRQPWRRHRPGRPKGCIMRKHAALEKQENQMVVKHRTGKPEPGISVFPGNSGASTLLSAFSFPLLCCSCLDFGRASGGSHL